MIKASNQSQPIQLHGSACRLAVIIEIAFDTSAIANWLMQEILPFLATPSVWQPTDHGKRRQLATKEGSGDDLLLGLSHLSNLPKHILLIQDLVM